MGTKELGWSAARFSAVRFLALTLSVSTVALAFTAHTAYAADQKKSRDRIVEFNKQALLSYEAKDFETAKELLTKALKEAKQAGLEDDKMTARTYLHMGAVYWVGFQDQSVALQNFALAKKIRPDIQLTPSIETADLKSVFDLAVAEPDAPAAKPAAPVRGTAQPRPAAPAPRVSDDGGGEPDLPVSMSAPLMCTVPSEVPPGKDLTMRCALKPGLNAKAVNLHHRAPGVEAYQVLAMRKTAKGWYLATLPGHVLKIGTLQIYFDARDGSDNEIASNGQVDSPSVIEIRKKDSSKRGGDGDGDDPLNRIRNQQRDESYEASLHRRREGAIWIGVGAGAGAGFVTGGNLEWRSKVKVSQVTAPTGLFHLVPELGYMYSDSFGLAVQARIEFIKQEQLPGQTGPSISGAPTDKAFALILRGINYMDLAGGNLQFTFSGDIGGGYIRVPVKPVAGNTVTDSTGATKLDDASTIYKTDTRPIGPVVFGAGGGLIYHFSRHFALALEARGLLGLPDFGAVFEGQLSMQIGLFGKAGPKPADEEGEGEGGGPDGPGPANDAPSPADPSPQEEE
jgi:hypothetical protein